MKLKTILSFLFSVVIGITFAFFMFYQYEDIETITPVSMEENEEVFVLQYGVYSSLESMQENTSKLTDYIYEIKEEKYYVYIGITKLEENASKIKEFYQKKGMNLYQKKLTIEGTNFLNKLTELDENLKNSSEVDKVCKEILNQYKELIIDVKNEGNS